MKKIKNWKTFNEHMKPSEDAPVLSDVKNKIFIIDISGSFINELKKTIDKIDFYLSDRFAVFLCDDRIQYFMKDTNLEELIKFIKDIRYGGGGGTGFQKAVDYIINNNLKGSVLVYTDGWIELDLTRLNNKLALLAFVEESKPKVDGDYQLFYKDLESLDHFYPPRDITYDKYILKRDSQKYNL